MTGAVGPATQELVPLDNITVAAENVRKANPEADLDELEESIRTVGLLQPVVLVRNDSRYELIVGQRRYLAIKALRERGEWAYGDRIPAVVYPAMDVGDRVLRSLTENLERKNLTFRDMLNAVKFLLIRYKKVSKVAKKLGVSQPTVYKYVEMTNLPEEIQELVEEKKITQTDARRAMAAAGGDPDKALTLSRKIPGLRADQKVKLVTLGTDRGDASAAELLKEARAAEREYRLTIILPKGAYGRLADAADELKLDLEATAARAVTEWLQSQGFAK